MAAKKIPAETVRAYQIIVKLMQIAVEERVFMQQQLDIMKSLLDDMISESVGDDKALRENALNNTKKMVDTVNTAITFYKTHPKNYVSFSTMAKMIAMDTIQPGAARGFIISTQIEFPIMLNQNKIPRVCMRIDREILGQK